MILFCEMYRSGHFILFDRILILSPLFEINNMAFIFIYQINL